MFELRVEDIRLARQTATLADQYRQARTEDDDQTTTNLEEQLRDALAERFELRQRIREREITDLEDRLVVLREQLDEQAQNKDAQIDEQFERITSEREPAEKPRGERMEL